MHDDSREKLGAIEKIVRDWVGKQGHDKCWYYPEPLRKIAETLGIEYPDPGLPSEAEFQEVCNRYRREIYQGVTVDGRPVPEAKKS